MLKKLENWVKELSRVSPPLDPKVFRNPLAEKISWEPLKNGGANFKTHALKQMNESRMEFRPTLGLRMFGFFFLLIPSVLIAMFIKGQFNGTELPTLVFVFPGLVSLPFIAVGIYFLFFSGRKCAAFDLTSSSFRPAGARTEIPIDQIAAFQIICERVRGNKTSYDSYELNAVLKDGSRHNLCDHGNLQQVRRDCDEILNFLQKKIPIWDATAAAASSFDVA